MSSGNDGKTVTQNLRPTSSRDALAELHAIRLELRASRGASRRDRDQLFADIARWRDNLLDLDIVVDDCRRSAHSTPEDLAHALEERNRAAAWRAALIDHIVVPERRCA